MSQRESPEDREQRVARAVRGMSSCLVRRIAGAMTKDIAAAVRESVAACRARMAEEGVMQSVVARLFVPPGTVVQGPVSVFDRKSAYLAECATMREFPVLREVFSDPVAALFSYGTQLKGEHAAKFQADMMLLFDRVQDQAVREQRLKALYKQAYGKLGNAYMADKHMPAELVADMKPIAELARRRNALCMLQHAKKLREHEGLACVAIATDALFVSGVTNPAVTLARMCAESPEWQRRPSKPKWKEESRGTLLLFGASVNAYVLASDDGAVVARPRHMFTTELSEVKTPAELAALQAAVVAAGRLPSPAARHAAFEACLARVPAECTTLTREGARKIGKSSLRLLLEQLCGFDAAVSGVVSPTRVYRKLDDAVQAQHARSTPTFVVAQARCNSAGHEYRTFHVVSPDRLREVCFGRKYHVVFVGDVTRVGYRGVLDWDAPTPLPAARVEAAASCLRAFWRTKKGLEVTVEALRTCTQRTGAKQHAEHVVFLAIDQATGKECVLLNVTEIPSALGLAPPAPAASSTSSSDSAGAVIPFDTDICKWRKSLRLASAPGAGDAGTTSAHVPKGVEGVEAWHPTADEFLRWCPVVAVHPTRTIGYCDTPPAFAAAAAAGRNDVSLLLPSAQTCVAGLWAYLRRTCHDYNFTRESVRFFTLNNQYNQFLVNVDIEKHGKYLDFKSFMRKVMRPQLSGGATPHEKLLPVGRSANHRSSNRSFFLLDVDLVTGALWRVQAKTHAEKTAFAETGAAATTTTTTKRRKTRATKQPSGAGARLVNHGQALVLSNAAGTHLPGVTLRRLLQPAELLDTYKRQLAAERCPTIRLLLVPPQGSPPGAPCIRRLCAPSMVWGALQRRHRVLRRRALGRALPEGNAARVKDELRALNVRSTCLAVTFVARYADHALALRAVCTEKHFYVTYHKDAPRTPALLALLEHTLTALKSRGQEGAALPSEGGEGGDAASAWASALTFAARCTYARAVL